MFALMINTFLGFGGNDNTSRAKQTFSLSALHFANVKRINEIISTILFHDDMFL